MLSNRNLIPDFVQQIARPFLQKHTLPRWMVFLQDNLAVFVCFIFAYLLRFNLIANAFEFRFALEQAIITTGIYALFSIIFRSYSGLIRHTTIVDIFNVLSATTLSLASLLFFSAVARSLHWPPVFTIPFSILMIHYVLITLILSVIRIVIKIFFLLISTTLSKEKKNTDLWSR